MYVKSLMARDFRCFGEVSVDFVYPTQEPGNAFPNLNLILGDNGSGKSSLLKAVALGVLGAILPDSGFRPYYLVRSHSKSGRSDSRIQTGVELLGELGELAAGNQEVTFSTVIERFGVENSFAHRATGLVVPGHDLPVVPDSLREADSPAFFLAGYGAARSAQKTDRYLSPSAQAEKYSPRYQRVAGLFDEDYRLIPFAPWMTRLSSGPKGEVHHHFESASQLLERLLSGTGISWTRGTTDGEAEFLLHDDPDMTVPTAALSDGFKAYLCWVTDLLARLVEATPANLTLDQLPGVVLVDEVDLHLHPAWQRRLFPTLARTFPRLQFIVTSHSPILAGCLPPENILVTERTQDGPSVVSHADKSYYGRAIDEILTGDYFELDSVLAPHLEEEAQREAARREKLARELLQAPSQETALSYLKQMEKS